MKKVLVAMDTGFDGNKICVNGVVFNIPFQIMDITGKEDTFMTSKDSPEFIRSIVDGRVYLVGNLAKVALLESTQRAAAKDMNTFYTLGRFRTKEYAVAVKSFLAYALYKYEEYSAVNDKEPFTVADLNAGKVELDVGIALPHSHREEIWENYVMPTLLQEQKVTLTIAQESPIHFNFKLEEDNLCFNSQVYSAMFAVTMDEEGNYIPEEISNDKLPRLVIDAGYLTVGIFEFSQSGQVVSAESNEEFAMHNVNERTAALAREYRSDITAYNIETLANRKEKIRYSHEVNGERKYEFFDVSEARSIEIERAAKNLNGYLFKNFNDLLDMKSIIVAGGTGDQYYQYLEPAYKERMIDAKLVKPVMFGKEYAPVFAVVIGLYRSMIAIFGK